MKQLFTILLILLIPSVFYANDFKKQYLDLLKKGDYPELLKHLNEWEKAKPDDPEMYIGYFNYYLNKERSEGITIDRKRKMGSEIEVVDPETNVTVGYLNNSVHYNDDDIKQAFIYLNRGLELYPKRLDMHFGKIHVLNEIEDYNNMTREINWVLILSKRINNKWLWSDNKPLDNPENFMLENIQARIYGLIQSDDETNVKYAVDLSNLLIKLYPKCIFGYSDLAVISINNADYTEAIEYLKKAESIDGKDIVIINNIAFCYSRLNDIENSRKYYKKLLKNDNPKVQQYARERLKELAERE